MSLNHAARFTTVCFALSLFSVAAVVAKGDTPMPMPPPPPPMTTKIIAGGNIHIQNNYIASSGGVLKNLREQYAAVTTILEQLDTARMNLKDAYSEYITSHGLIYTKFQTLADMIGPTITTLKKKVTDVSGSKTQIPITSLTSLIFQGITQSEATGYATQFLYSDARTGLDIGLQSEHGNAELGGTLGRRSLDGYRLSLEFDLTDYRSVVNREIAIVKDDIANIDAIDFESKSGHSLVDKLNNVNTEIQNLSVFVKSHPWDDSSRSQVKTQVDAIDMLLGNIESKIQPLETDGEQLFAYDKEISYAEKIVRSKRNVDILALASFDYLRPIGSTREAGFALARLTPWHTGSKSSKRRRYYGIETALNVEGVWFSPSTELSNAFPGFSNRNSAIRTNLAAYWQDGAPYVDSASGDLIPNRWHFQIGGEYQFTNVVDGEDTYDLFVRYRNPSQSGRNDGPEVALSVGKSAANSVQVGLSVGFHFASTH